MNRSLVDPESVSSTQQSEQLVSSNQPTTSNSENFDEGSLADNLNENNTTNPDLDEFLSNSVGYVKPHWIPDKEAPVCMFCNAKFNLINRRHHCRYFSFKILRLISYIDFFFLNIDKGPVVNVAVLVAAIILLNYRI